MRLYLYMKCIKQVVKLNNTAVCALIYKVDQEVHISASTTTTLLTSSIFVFFFLQKVNLRLTIATFILYRSLEQHNFGFYFHSLSLVLSLPAHIGHFPRTYSTSAPLTLRFMMLMEIAQTYDCRKFSVFALPAMNINSCFFKLELTASPTASSTASSTASVTPSSTEFSTAFSTT